MAEMDNEELEGGGQEIFSSLGLKVGAVVTIEIVSTLRKYSVQLLGYSENKSILISSPLREGKEVLLDKNSVIAVRMLVGKRVCAFEARILYRSIQPYSYYHLSYPESVEALQVRNSERVTTSIETEVDSDFDIVGEWPKLAYINNISSTGARLNSAYSLGVSGHELILNFDVQVSDRDLQLKLSSVIRNVEHNGGLEDDDTNRFVYGVEFIDLDDEQHLSLSSYIYEQNKT